MSQFFNIQWTIGAALDSRGPGFDPQMGYPKIPMSHKVFSKKSWICLNGPQVESSCSIEGSCLEKSAHPTVYLVGRVVANY